MPDQIVRMVRDRAPKTHIASKILAELSQIELTLNVFASSPPGIGEVFTMAQSRVDQVLAASNTKRLCNNIKVIMRDSDNIDVVIIHWKTDREYLLCHFEKITNG